MTSMRLEYGINWGAWTKLGSIEEIGKYIAGLFIFYIELSPFSGFSLEKAVILVLRGVPLYPQSRSYYRHAASELIPKYCWRKHRALGVTVYC